MSTKKVVIIDYQLGNLFSVKHACDHVGLNATISSEREALQQADAILLPGVGAFHEAMHNLANLDLIHPIHEAVAQGKPFFGICLGLQLLFSRSEEFGFHRGLELIEGSIKKFPTEIGGQAVKVPQITWNQVIEAKQWKGTPMQDIKDGEHMYFVHSFYAEAENQSDVLSSTSYYGLKYCSSVHKGNIFATQFHPEKSADKGLSIYKNWGVLNGLL